MNNKQLINKYQKTYDKKIKEQLIENNISLVRKIAKKYTVFESIDIDELCSYGYEGLIIAINKFNPDLKSNFSTFAYNYVQRYIIKGICETYELKRNEFLTIYLYKNNENKSNLLEDKLTNFEEITDEYYYNNSEQDNILNNLFIEQLKNKFNFLFTYLTQIQESVIKLSFGFDCNKKKIEEIAKIYNISINQVIRIKTRALKELKNLASFTDLNEYLEYFNDMNDDNSKLLYKQKRNQN